MTRQATPQDLQGLKLTTCAPSVGQTGQHSDRYVPLIRFKLGCAFHEGGLGLMVGLVIAAGQAAVIFIGVRNVQAGTLTLGNLLLVMGYLSQLYRPLQSISKKVGDLQRSLASAERTFALLDQTPEVIGPALAVAGTARQVANRRTARRILAAPIVTPNLISHRQGRRKSR